jgi:hypothetical protein
MYRQTKVLTDKSYQQARIIWEDIMYHPKVYWPVQNVSADKKDNISISVVNVSPEKFNGKQTYQKQFTSDGKLIVVRFYCIFSYCSGIDRDYHTYDTWMD